MPDLRPIVNSNIERRPADAPVKVDPHVYSSVKPIAQSTHLLWWTLVLAAVIVLIGLAFGVKFISAINSTNSTSGKKISFFQQLSHLVSNPEEQLKGASDDRINIILAGIGGAGHEGAYLTDTLILVSIKPSTNEIATISIPRDLVVEFPKYGWRKINNALAFGTEMDYPGGGEALLTKVVGDVTGLTINYYARIDFEGFRKAIDDLGGIDVYIDNTFTDSNYPDYSHGYQTVKFTKGWEHMNGERALQFARSRHGCCGEGSDFARSKRQQKILLAMKNKFFSINSVANPSSIISVLTDIGTHNQTNIEVWEMVQFAKIAKDINKDNIINMVLDNSTHGLLESATGSDGAYILQPKDGDYSAIQSMAANIFSTGQIIHEQANIEIQNGTTQTGLASKTADRLTALNYKIARTANAASNEPVTQTTIYDLSGGTKPYTLAGLKNTLDARLSATPPANYLNANTTAYSNANSNTNTAQAIDILIIVGTDQSATTAPAGQTSAARRTSS
ncbi:MAG: LCP family protein [Patescibacteria group bacterium]